MCSKEIGRFCRCTSTLHTYPLWNPQHVPDKSKIKQCKKTEGMSGTSFGICQIQ